LTWFTSHLALEGLIAFILIGSTLRQKFLTTNATKLLFLSANTMAIVPDLDVYLGILFGNRTHRGPSHSITFPLLFILLGYLAIIYNKRSNKHNIDRDLDQKTLFGSKLHVKEQIKHLLPYFFFLAAFYWGLHLVLDMDSGEGGMMLFWPLDDRLYQIGLVFKLDANPFLILPWTPLGSEFTVSQSTVQGLFSYLFNWTPQDFIDYRGTTIFYYSFVGLIFHILILITWIYFVLKPFWPFKGGHIGVKTDFLSFFTKFTSFWHKVSKEILIPGIMLVIIGFTLGPLVGERVSDSQSISTDLTFTENSFNAMTFVPLDSISQPLDFNANFFVNISYKVSNLQIGEEIAFIIASKSFFLTVQQEINQLASTIITTAKPANDTIFKSSYSEIISSNVLNDSTDYLEVITTNQTSDAVFNFNLPSKNDSGIGFILKNWSSKENWTDSNTKISVIGNLEVSYSRAINFYLGVTIELTGLFLIGLALVNVQIKKKQS
jgi:hypothetical protein